ncbi:uncharacterized protein LOC108654281 [Drosophila navojoa]|uniref:uncharacterized protein LOC108654281 n=1 Tax=Drosophila navojoa TaxID=7232 RepID=UPI0008468780|nr:uncharacterized protein LOC108654281 [Drosophila navojoa]
MRTQLCYLWFFSCFLTYLGATVDRVSMDKLGFHNNYNAIVRDLIKNWESPIVYLRQLGYLPKDYEDTSKIKPSLDALMSRIEHDDQPNAIHSEGDKGQQQFCGANDGKKMELQKKKKKKRKAILLQPQKGKRRDREANATQGVAYPTVDQLLAMVQHTKPAAIGEPKAQPLEPQPKPVEQVDNSKLQLLGQMFSEQRQEPVQQEQPVQSAAKATENESLLQRLVKIINTSSEPKPLETAEPNIVGNLPQYSIEQPSPMGAYNMMKMLNESPGKSVSSYLASKKADGDTIARIRRNLKSRLIRKSKHRNI